MMWIEIALSLVSTLLIALLSDRILTARFLLTHRPRPPLRIRFDLH